MKRKCKKIAGNQSHRPVMKTLLPKVHVFFH